jgi:hypothetical protein
VVKKKYPAACRSFYRKGACGAAALPAVLSVIAALLSLFAGCPLTIPEKVRLKANPAIYLPLGSPDNFANINFDFGKMAEVNVGAGGDTVVCDYPGEFPETRAFLAWTRLVEHAFPSPAVPPPAGGVSVPVPIPVIPPGSTEGIDLTDLQGLLEGYPGLQFRTVTGYLYFNGPATLLRKGDLSLDLTINNGTNPVKTGVFTLSPTSLPDPLPQGDPVTRPLSPKPEARIDLTGVLNDPANKKLNFEYSISSRPSIEIPPEDLPAFLEEFNTPLTIYLAIVLPLWFTAPEPIPVLVADEASRPDSSAIATDEEGTDLFGREGGDASDTLQKMLNNMSSLGLNVSVTNNLGVGGFFTMNKGVRPVADRPSPLAPLDDALGRIGLSGNSTVTLSKAEIEATNPFNPVFELFLEGDFDIPRAAAGRKPLEMSLGVVVQTAIDKVF